MACTRRTGPSPWYAERTNAHVGDPVKQIVAALTPYLGEHMARSAALAHCQKLGISGPDVSAEQIDKLVDRLQTGLYVFIGREKSAAVMAAIRQTLRGQP